MAHEFNNILAAIQGYVQLMKMKVETDNPLADYIAEIDTNCQRAAGLTRKMLTFSRSEVGEKKLVKINQLVDGMHRLLQQTLPAQIELKIDLQPNLPFIRAEGNQLEQVMLNLAVNARDAMPNGGTLTIRTGRETDCLCTAIPWEPRAVYNNRSSSPGRHAGTCYRTYF